MKNTYSARARNLSKKAIEDNGEIYFEMDLSGIKNVGEKILWEMEEIRKEIDEILDGRDRICTDCKYMSREEFPDGSRRSTCENKESSWYFVYIFGRKPACEKFKWYRFEGK